MKVEKKAKPNLAPTDNWKQVFEAELHELGKKNKADSLSALCLSGGGVRSAVVCMGVMQFLAKRKMLSTFDYVSSVSGGGYAGTALAYWLREQRETGDLDDACPFAESHPKQRAYMRHVRANINYLMPSGFRSLLGGSYVVVRSILINVAIWTILLAMLLEALLQIGFGMQWLYSLGKQPETGYLQIFDLQATSAKGADNIVAPPGSLIDIFQDYPLFALASGFGLLLLFLAFIQMPIFSIGTSFKKIPEPQNPTWLQRLFLGGGYRWRRYNERYGGILIGFGSLLVLIGFLPLIGNNLDAVGSIFDGSSGDANAPSSTVATFGIIGTVAGIATSIFGFFRAKLGGIFGGFSKATMILGSALLVFSIALLGMVIALAPGFWITVFFAMIALSLAYFCNINDVSLGRYYRDQLMETFMPNYSELGEKGKLAEVEPLATTADTTTFYVSEPEEMTSPADTEQHKKVRDLPIHLIGTNVACHWSDDSRARRRRGDNFVISRLWCGSDVTGWKSIKTVAKGKLTLPTAMATSGAAVSPGSGFAGGGATTNPVIAFAMSLLSLRLGYWLRWSDHSDKRDIWGWGNRLRPSAEMTWKRLLNPKRDRGCTPEYLDLTDGGHFDNLGLYEVIRRKCRLIVICDGAEDPSTSYASFSSTIRRVREDFGAEINFDVRTLCANFENEDPKKGKKCEPMPSGPQDLVARDRDDEYPNDTPYAEKGYFLASITYANQEPLPDGDLLPDGYRETRADGPETGLIIYLKSAMIRSLALTTKGYRGRNPKFPFDPTSNQFFSPEQFEAYRDIGYKIAMQMNDDIQLQTLLASDDFLETGEKLLANDWFEKQHNVETGSMSAPSMPMVERNLKSPTPV